MEEAFEERDAVRAQIALEVIDFLIAPRPQLISHRFVRERGREFPFGEFVRVNSLGGYLFVVGAVEDANLSGLGQLADITPEVIMLKIFFARLVKRSGFASL